MELQGLVLPVDLNTDDGYPKFHLVFRGQVSVQPHTLGTVEANGSVEVSKRQESMAPVCHRSLIRDPHTIQLPNLPQQASEVPRHLAGRSPVSQVLQGQELETGVIFRMLPLPLGVSELLEPLETLLRASSR